MCDLLTTISANLIAAAMLLSFTCLIIIALVNIAATSGRATARVRIAEAEARKEESITERYRLSQNNPQVY